MRRLILMSLGGLAACHGQTGPTVTDQAEALVRQYAKDPAVQFKRVQFTGDDRSGQTCGYFTRPNALGGTDAVRFIVFIDGNGGQNPFIDEASAPYPRDKSLFAFGWREQCVKLGYTG